MNMKKIKVMFNNQLAGQQIMIGNETLERVEEYIYYGQTVGANPAHDKEIKKKMGVGWSAFGKLYDIMTGSLPLYLKGKVYNHCVLPILTYGLETWHLTKEQERKLRSAQRGMERTILGITWRDRKRATWIKE